MNIKVESKSVISKSKTNKDYWSIIINLEHQNTETFYDLRLPIKTLVRKTIRRTMYAVYSKSKQLESIDWNYFREIVRRNL